KATQSSTTYGGEPARAIDGNTNGDFSADSTTHTAEANDPWGEVDLGKTANVDRVVLWNRTDSSLQSRLKDARVVLLDEGRKQVWENRLAAVPDPSVALATSGPQPVALR